jgi:hypothetical protein
VVIAITLALTQAGQSQVWVVSDPASPRGIWVIDKKPAPVPKLPAAKVCPCSNLCTCGCNEGEQCRCQRLPIGPRAVLPVQVIPTDQGRSLMQWFPLRGGGSGGGC